MRPAPPPKKGSAKRSPCHALSDRTTHRKNIPSKPTIPSSNNRTAAAILESSIHVAVARKNTPHNDMLCQAWKRTKRLLRNAGRNRSTAAGNRMKYPATAAHRSAGDNGVIERPHLGQNAAPVGIEL